MPPEALGTFLLVGIALIAAAAVLVLPGYGSPEGDRRVGALVRLASVAAVSAVLCALMYVAYAAEPIAITRMIGDAAMALAPGILWAALHALRRPPWIPIALACAGAVVTAVVSIVTPGWVSSGIKVVFIICWCTLLFIESQLPELRTITGALVVGAMCLGYAAYSVMRIVAAFALGTSAAAFQSYFGSNAASLVGGVAILGCAGGIVLMRRALVPRRQIGTAAANVQFIAGAILLQGQTLTAFTIRLPELRLIRTALGYDTAHRLSEAASAAAYDVLPDAMLTATRAEDVIVALDIARRSPAATARRIREAFVSRIAGIPDAEDTEFACTFTAIRDAAALARVLALTDPRITNRPHPLALTDPAGALR